MFLVLATELDYLYSNTSTLPHGRKLTEARDLSQLIAYNLITKRPADLPMPPLTCGFGKPLKEPSRGRVIDAFLFNGEWDVVEARIYELASIVDYFIIVEDEYSFTGMRKLRTFPYLLEERLFQFKDKIIYVDGRDTRNSCLERINRANQHSIRDVSFSCEIAQRDSVRHHVPNGIKPTDYIQMADADELPSEHFFRSVRYCDFQGKSVGFETRTHHYSLHFPGSHRFATTACIGSYLLNGNQPLQKCHKSNSHPHELNQETFHGWHMSYFGSPYFIRKKLMSYAETQTNTAPYNQIGYIKNHAYGGRDLLDRDSIFNFQYNSYSGLSGPWFYLANKQYRSSFGRYGRKNNQDDTTHRPSCLSLSYQNLHSHNSLSFQLFGLLPTIALSYRLGLPYTLPTEEPQKSGMEGGQNHNIWDSAAMDWILSDSYFTEDCQPLAEQSMTWSNYQDMFSKKNFYPSQSIRISTNDLFPFKQLLPSNSTVSLPEKLPKKLNEDLLPFVPILRHRLTTVYGIIWRENILQQGNHHHKSRILGIHYNDHWKYDVKSSGDMSKARQSYHKYLLKAIEKVYTKNHMIVIYIDHLGDKSSQNVALDSNNNVLDYLNELKKEIIAMKLSDLMENMIIVQEISAHLFNDYNKNRFVQSIYHENKHSVALQILMQCDDYVLTPYPKSSSLNNLNSHSLASLVASHLLPYWGAFLADPLTKSVVVYPKDEVLFDRLYVPSNWVSL